MICIFFYSSLITSSPTSYIAVFLAAIFCSRSKLLSSGLCFFFKLRKLKYTIYTVFDFDYGFGFDFDFDSLTVAFLAGALGWDERNRRQQPAV